MTSEERRQLDEQGFVVLEHCMGGDLLRELRERIDAVRRRKATVPGTSSGPRRTRTGSPISWTRAKSSAARSCCRE